MNNKFYYPLILLLTIIISFPSICFSEMKTIEHEYCDKYKGNMKNKKELDDFRIVQKTTTVVSGVLSLTDPSKNQIKIECIRYILDNYLEKSVFVSHKEKGRNICNKVRITFDPDMVDKYLTQENCVVPETKTEKEIGNRWTYYGTSEDGDLFYDNSSITKVSNGVIKVWRKIQPPKVKEGYTLSLRELDCVNRTTKYLRIILYNEQGKIKSDFELPNPKIQQIIPESSEDVLLEKVCPKK